LNTSGTLSAFSTTAGTASAAQTFTASGSNLAGNLVVTAPTGFEVSSNGASYASSVHLTATSGTVGTTTIYVRIAASAAVGSLSGNVTVSSTGAMMQIVPVSGVAVGQSTTPPRPNTFILQSAQAGSTTDIDNLRVVDLDSSTVVYSNEFSQSNQATQGLKLFYFPQGGANTTNFVKNGPMTRVVGGKLRLETTGFGANGSGGYESHSEAEFTGTLPKNFLVEFDAVRLQWPGHFHFHVSYRDPSDPPSSHEPYGAYTTNRVAKYRLDWLRMAASGSWFQQ